MRPTTCTDAPIRANGGGGAEGVGLLVLNGGLVGL